MLYCFLNYTLQFRAAPLPARGIPLPLTELRTTTHPRSFSFHTLTNCPFCNSFPLISLQMVWGCGGYEFSNLLATFSSSQHLTSAFSYPSTFSCTFLHLLAPNQNSNPFMSYCSTLFGKNTREWDSSLHLAPDFSAVSSYLWLSTLRDFDDSTSHESPVSSQFR